MFRWLFLLFLLVPLVELYFLIQVGDVIGAGWTILLVLATAAIGAYLVRLQGFQTMIRAQASLAQGDTPAMEMLEGVMLLFSGFLLLLPGFVTDIVGFLLLVPALRRSIIAQGFKHQRFVFRKRHHGFGQSRYDDGEIIEGEVVDEPDNNKHLH